MKNNYQLALLIGNVAAVLSLIILTNLGFLPLRMGDFIFLAVILFFVALYRPSWGFAFFVGMIMLENINLAPIELGLAVRPYQLIGGLTLLAVSIRFLTKRLNFELDKFRVWDGAMIFLGVGSFLSLLNALNVGLSLKQSIVMLSYLALYFLVRIFLQTKDDLKKVLPFFLSSSLVVLFYAIWQNVRFLHNLPHFEVMPGRPNGTFTEPDWLGVFLSLLLALAYSLTFYLYKNRGDSHKDVQIFKLLLFLFVVLTYVTLVLTVARSAWVGAVAVTATFLVVILTQLKMSYKTWKWKDVIRMKLMIIVLFLLSVGVVYVFNLTTFQLENRLQSTGSGKQEITVSCDAGSDIPRTIADISELGKFNCQHINLEDIENEKTSGRLITNAYRNDPNINIRKEIYIKSWEEIEKNPILGIGWGSITGILGEDERGAGLNASNIFLEVWLGAGLIGVISIVSFLGFALYNSIRFFLKQDQFFGLFLLLGSISIIIPNLFNSGIFLGFVWLFLGLALIRR
jgi:hypothetical protein